MNLIPTNIQEQKMYANCKLASMTTKNNIKHNTKAYINTPLKKTYH
jgi:hypothetical protein